jgi:hypothetical protein
MLAAIEQVESTAAPVCLAPWLENSYRLVSLLDMLQFSVESWYSIESLITDCILKSGAGDVPYPIHLAHQPVSGETIEKAREWLDKVHDGCARIGLNICAETITEIRDGLVADKQRDWEWLKHQLHGLQKMIRKEMKSKTFFYITPEKMRFWITSKNPYPLGESAHNAFQSAELDAAEAGICLAVARPTASVFHSMRVLEVGLSALGKIFNVSLEHTNWGPAIDEIEARIRNMHKDPAWKALPDCKAQQEFYAQAASHFGILKDAWRNYTAHKRGIYTEERATLIFENLRAFMQTLAARLHE